VIIVVEGPCGAGKTTCAARTVDPMRFSNRSPTAPSFRPMERPLPTSGSNATSPPKFMSASSATASSSSAPIAFKLHFSWALHQSG